MSVFHIRFSHANINSHYSSEHFKLFHFIYKSGRWLGPSHNSILLYLFSQNIKFQAGISPCLRNYVACFCVIVTDLSMLFLFKRWVSVYWYCAATIVFYYKPATNHKTLTYVIFHFLKKIFTTDLVELYEDDLT